MFTPFRTEACRRCVSVRPPAFTGQTLCQFAPSDATRKTRIFNHLHSPADNAPARLNPAEMPILAPPRRATATLASGYVFDVIRRRAVREANACGVGRRGSGVWGDASGVGSD